MRGNHFLKSWSATQRSIALSSAEAELVAAVKLSTEVLGITQLAADWGLRMQGKIYVDSSAAIGVVHRRGAGKLRHVRVGTFWIQEKVEDKELEVRKVKGDGNPADLLTKNVNREKVDKFSAASGVDFRGGRAEKSLETARDVST